MTGPTTNIIWPFGQSDVFVFETTKSLMPPIGVGNWLMWTIDGQSNPPSCIDNLFILSSNNEVMKTFPLSLIEHATEYISRPLGRHEGFKERMGLSFVVVLACRPRIRD